MEMSGVQKFDITNSSTGLAVWFEKRDRQWLAANRLAIFLGLLLVLLACAAETLVQIYMMQVRYQIVPRLPNEIMRPALQISLYAHYVIGLVCIFLCIARLRFILPLGDALGSQALGEFFRVLRSAAIASSLMTSAWLLLPLLAGTSIGYYFLLMLLRTEHEDIVVNMAMYAVIPLLQMIFLATSAATLVLKIPRLSFHWQYLAVLLACAAVMAGESLLMSWPVRTTIIPWDGENGIWINRMYLAITCLYYISCIGLVLSMLRKPGPDLLEQLDSHG